ncbi:Glycosyl transferase, family 2 (fragment) [Planktothrix serta PCC 8927]|uniref:Glycosyl transferase, family 2 n=1 Tax=Planktothrix serta PCC 8927 TaxID=671068 RepID=A0A7Z9BI78_9CYAN
MLEILDLEIIQLSVIIPYWQQRDFLLDMIINLEYNLEVNYEIIILGDRNLLNFDLADILNYLKAQGHRILFFECPFQAQEIFNQAIAQAQGQYILWVQYPVLFFPEGLREAITILEENLEVCGVYSNSLFALDDINQSLNFKEIGAIFRKTIWQTEIILKEDLLNIETLNWEFQFKSSSNDLIFYPIHNKILEPIINNRSKPETQEFKIQEYPLVSVCIPAYNGELFIAEAISSILSQTYCKIELIISDDHSQDNTVAIAQSFQDQTTIPLSILTPNHQGLAQNSNFCIEQSQGKYIKFLYQDDILTPNCIEKMVTLAETDPEIGLVFSPREMFFLNQNDIDLDLIAVYQEFANLHQSWSNLNSIQWGTELLADPNLWEHPINKIGEPSTVLLRKSVLETVGYFDPQLNQLVDLDLWWRILGQFKVGFVEETLSYFRLHSQQKTHQNMQEGKATDINFYDKIYSHPDYNFLTPLSRHQAFLIYNFILKDS